MNCYEYIWTSNTIKCYSVKYLLVFNYVSGPLVSKSNPYISFIFDLYRKGFIIYLFLLLLQLHTNSVSFDSFCVSPLISICKFRISTFIWFFHWIFYIKSRHQPFYCYYSMLYYYLFISFTSQRYYIPVVPPVLEFYPSKFSPI